MKRWILCIVLCAVPGLAKKFYVDDPLVKEPRPRNVASVASRDLSDYYDILTNSLTRVGQQNGDGKLYPAQGVNTLGEPMDGPWWVARHYYRRMSLQELTRGPGGQDPPQHPFTIIKVKTQGVTPGFTAKDRRGKVYFFKFDPVTNPEMASAAEIISERFFHALGYHVFDGYILQVNPKDITIQEGVTHINARGLDRPFTHRELNALLWKVPKKQDGLYRVFASKGVEGKPVGPYEYSGVRSDDPNDVVLHEHRRDLRGLGVFSAWLGHDDSRALNTLDTLVEEDGVKFLKHYVSDLGSTLGSGSTRTNSPRSGNEYLFSWREASKQFLTLGLMPPAWALSSYPEYPSIGKIASASFDPEKWVPEYPNAAFRNRLPDDGFWAAKQVMAFTDEEIAAIVRTGALTDKAAEAYLIKVLQERRDKVGKVYFQRVLPLDRFRVANGTLEFDDLGQRHGMGDTGPLTVKWASFDNDAEKASPLPDAAGFRVPPAPATGFAVATIEAASRPKQTVVVYLRYRGGTVEVVGVERTW